MKWLALKMIRGYQKTLSFDHGPMKVFHKGGFCPYQPTCSQYTYDAVNKYGVLKGSWLGMKRIYRCNPWTKGGWDPVR